MWCDDLVILLHECSDQSPEIAYALADEYQGRVVISHMTGEWAEMQHRQWMLELARKVGATHVAITDADEIISGNILPDVSGPDVEFSPRWYAGQMPQGSILQLPGYNLRGSLNRYHNNGIWGNRWFSLAFKDDPNLSWSGDKFHSREPHGAPLKAYRPISQGQGGILHLWGASERRLRAKSALYKITERLRWPSKPIADIELMYSWAVHGQAGHPSFGTPETWTYADVPASWWAPYSHLVKYLDVEAEPWQEAECQRLVAEHGREKFKGLDLFGVA
jgi:hypothetical protein